MCAYMRGMYYGSYNELKNPHRIKEWQKYKRRVGRMCWCCQVELFATQHTCWHNLMQGERERERERVYLILCYLEHPHQCSVCELAKLLFFFTSKFSYLLFCNPTHKTMKRRRLQTNRWGTTNNKPPGPIITISQSKNQGAAVISHLLLSFLLAAAN